MQQHVKYGLVVFVALLFVGWITGMGGSLVPNLAFSAAMGVMAGGCFWLVVKYVRNRNE